MKKEKAYITLVKKYGIALVHKLLPVVEARGFSSICEISVGDDFTVGSDGYILVEPSPGRPWEPMFPHHERDLWNDAAGYVLPEQPEITLLSPIGEISGVNVGQTLAQYLIARCRRFP